MSLTSLSNWDGTDFELALLGGTWRVARPAGDVRTGEVAEGETAGEAAKVTEGCAGDDRDVRVLFEGMDKKIWEIMSSLGYYFPNLGLAWVSRMLIFRGFVLKFLLPASSRAMTFLINHS
jgi:hypothetical protein